MPVTTIPLTAISVQQSSQTRAYGTLATIPLKGGSSEQRALMRAALTGIPSNAVVSSASIQVAQYKSGTGSVTLTASALTGSFSTKTTWKSQPATTATDQASQTRTAPAAKSLWTLSLTAMVQGWVSGSVPNRGFQLATTSTTAGSIRGQAASSGRPTLVVEWMVLPAVPTGLHPSGGVVSKTRPTLAFTVGNDVTAIQVQVDPASNAVSPAFDSGEVASVAGLYDLTASSYAGLASGSTTWRTRVKNALGWSAWSGWATFTRVAWGTTTITNPDSVSEDPSPPVVATYSGTATAWRVQLFDASSRLVEDSGWVPGSVIEYGPTAPVGTAGRVNVLVRDDVERIATPGDPDYLSTSLSFTVTPSGIPSAPTGLSVSQFADRPWVRLTAVRSEIPDELVIYRNGEVIHRAAGIEVFEYERLRFTDYTAPMNRPAVYTMRAVVNGAFSDEVPPQMIVPRTRGVWLVDPDTGAEVVLWGDGDAEQDEPEVAIVHTPIGGSVVRRRLARSPRRGSLEGTVIDAAGIFAADVEGALNDWIEADAGHLYRLVLGNRNDRVILGNIQLSEVPVNGAERVLGVSLDWWRE